MKNTIDLRVAGRSALRVVSFVSMLALASAPDALARWGGGGGGGGGYGGRGRGSYGGGGGGFNNMGAGGSF